MKISAATLKKVVELISKEGAISVEVEEHCVSGLPVLVIKFEDRTGAAIAVRIAEELTGAFDYIVKTERF